MPKTAFTRVCTGVCQAGTDPPNMLARFSYDGNGRRATKTAGGVTTSYFYDGAQFLEERPSVGATKRHVYGPDIDQPLAQIVGGTTTYNVADHLGSIVRTTDSLGNPIPTLTRQYDPWGNPSQGAATSGYALTGREWDAETGLYYYRARYYDPTLGRFLSEDPAGSGYSYAGNDPIAWNDPFGLEQIYFMVRTEIRPPGAFGQTGVKTEHAVILDTDSGRIIGPQRKFIGRTAGVKGAGSIPDATSSGGGGTAKVQFSLGHGIHTRALPSKFSINYDLTICYDSGKHEGKVIGWHTAYPSIEVWRDRDIVYEKDQGGGTPFSLASPVVRVDKTFH
jgi:RHS repeat-associated protein